MSQSAAASLFFFTLLLMIRGPEVAGGLIFISQEHLCHNAVIETFFLIFLNAGWKLMYSTGAFCASRIVKIICNTIVLVDVLWLAKYFGKITDSLLDEVITI